MDESPSVDQHETDWPSIMAVTLGITAFATAKGLTYPLLSFLLNDLGASEFVIGMHTSAFMVGFVASVLMLPTLNSLFRAGHLIAGGLAVAALSLVGFAVVDDLTAWLVFRFVLGSCVNTI